jgi:hypothetical protein
MIRLSVRVAEDGATPFLRKVNEVIGAAGGDRRDLHRYVSTQVAEAARDHVRFLVPTRHATARALGAQSTRHLSRAAASIEGQFDSRSAYLTFPRTTGLSRAFRPFNLRPVTPGIRFLTIAASARSYGRRAREFGDLEFDVIEATVGGRTAMRRALVFPDGTPAYWLVRKADIPQDRTLLPSDETFATAAEIGARDYIKAITTD